MRIRLNRRNGSATVEFAVCLPLYLLVLFGILFFGQATFVDQEMNLARAYATFNAGQDTDGELNRNILSSYLGVLNVKAVGRKTRAQGGYADPENDPYVAKPFRDVDGDGEWDRYVDVETDFMNTGPFANLHWNYAKVDPDEDDVIEGAWLKLSETIIQYEYTPAFLNFIFAEQDLTPGQYITYQMGGQVPSFACRECHGSAVFQRNYRFSARDYRSRQNPNYLPAPGQESQLWSQHRLRDMKVLLGIIPDSGASDPYPLPPADEISNEADEGFVRPDIWNYRYVLFYGSGAQPR